VAYIPDWMALANARSGSSQSETIEQLERFRAKWKPVRVKKTRQNIRLEPGFDQSKPQWL
jgi:hypothetical protein